MIHLQQVQLLVSDSDVESYKQIKADLGGLRLLVEKSELWVYKAKITTTETEDNSAAINGELALPNSSGEDEERTLSHSPTLVSHFYSPKLEWSEWIIKWGISV